MCLNSWYYRLIDINGLVDTCAIVCTAKCAANNMQTTVIISIRVSVCHHVAQRARNYTQRINRPRFAASEMRNRSRESRLSTLPLCVSSIFRSWPEVVTYLDLFITARCPKTQNWLDGVENLALKRGTRRYSHARSRISELLNSLHM